MDLIITVSTWLPDETSPEDVRRVLTQESETQSRRLVDHGRTGSVTVEAWKNNEQLARATQQVVPQEETDVNPTRH